MIINAIFVFLLHEIAWISYMMGVHMKLNPKQHPSMYYDANTHIRNSDMFILMFPSTETSHLDGTIAYGEKKT